MSRDHVARNLASSVVYSDLSGLLDWLLFSHSTVYSSCLKVVWDLSGLVRLVARGLPAAVLSQLSRPPHRTVWGSYKLFLLPDKVFSIEKNGSESCFYDLSQYFPEAPEPSSLEELQGKADQLKQTLSCLGLTGVTTLASPVAVFRGRGPLGGAEDIIPTIFDVPSSVLEAFEVALQCTPREWVSNYQIGRFPDLWSYDIASAYPWEASRLIDLRDCDFERSTEMRGSAYYGFLVGDFTVYPDHPLAFCSPFLVDRGDGTLVPFVGTKRDYSCSLDEVRVLLRYGLGEFKQDFGWFISPSSGVRPRFPFKAVMDSLYSERGDAELKSYFVKRVMNGLIGKLLEVRKDASGSILEYGELFNPIYHALCTTGTRLQVFDFLVRNAITAEELVLIGVDGVKSTRFIELPSRVSMGRWRSSDSDSTVVLSPGGVLASTRRFKHMDYADFVIRCLERPGARMIWKERSDPVDLHKLFINQIRVFPELPRTAGDLLGKRYLSSPVAL